MMYRKTSEKNINTSISTVADLVGVDNHIPDILWSRIFQSQGILVEYNIIFQDNQRDTTIKKAGNIQLGSIVGTSTYTISLSLTVLSISAIPIMTHGGHYQGFLRQTPAEGSIPKSISLILNIVKLSYACQANLKGVCLGIFSICCYHNASYIYCYFYSGRLNILSDS